MKRIFFFAAILLLLTCGALAIDEDTYVRFAADSIIAAHKFKGNSGAMEKWISEIKHKYPDFMNQDWQSFEQRMASDSALKERVYDAILTDIRAKGYTAHIKDLGGGAKTVEIED